jgi:hypothetical protein
MIEKSFTLTASLAVVIAVAAMSVLVVLTSLAGQRNGLRHSCPTLSQSAARAVAVPGYGERLAKLSVCGL